MWREQQKQSHRGRKVERVLREGFGRNIGYREISYAERPQKNVGIRSKRAQLKGSVFFFFLFFFFTVSSEELFKILE